MDGGRMNRYQIYDVNKNWSRIEIQPNRFVVLTGRAQCNILLYSCTGKTPHALRILRWYAYYDVLLHLGSQSIYPRYEDDDCGKTVWQRNILILFHIQLVEKHLLVHNNNTVVVISMCTWMRSVTSKRPIEKYVASN